MKSTLKLLTILVVLFFTTSSFSQARYKANSLEKGQYLTVNQSLRSHNGLYTLIMQTDGNLCIYKNGNEFIWCAMSNNRQKNTLKMQSDGNLVTYDRYNKPIWSTDTYRGGITKTGKMLVLQNDGNLMLYNQYNKAIWTSKNGRLY